MFKAVGTNRSLVSLRGKLLSLSIALCLSVVSQAHVLSPAPAVQSNDGLRLELPANGNLRIENLRGAVMAELWQENYVSVAAITDSGQQTRSPAIIGRTDSLLSVRVPQGTANAARINLEL